MNNGKNILPNLKSANVAFNQPTDRQINSVPASQVGAKKSCGIAFVMGNSKNELTNIPY